MSGKHTTYIVTVYQVDEGLDHSDKIKLAVNTALGTQGNANKVEEKKDESE